MSGGGFMKVRYESQHHDQLPYYWTGSERCFHSETQCAAYRAEDWYLGDWRIWYELYE
jgi:hypothetical protein